MSNLDTIVPVAVFGQTRTPVAKGFGQALVVAYHTHNTDVWRKYTSVAAMASDGFDTEEPAYLMVNQVFAQNPRPESVLVRRGPAATCTRTITITTSTEGDVVSFSIRVPDGSWQNITYTVLAAATTATVATAVELLVEAVSGITSSAAGAVITVGTDTVGKIFDLRAPVNCTVLTTTADPGYAAALSAQRVVNDDFFFVLTEVNSPLSITATAAWAESNKKLYFWQSGDTIEENGASAIGAAQKALGYEYSASFFVYDTSEYATAAAAGFCGARIPGKYTLSMKLLKGVTPVPLTDTQRTNLIAAAYNWYDVLATNLNGVLGPHNGGLTTGGNLYIDITHGRDWWIARAQEACVTIMASRDKVSYDDEDVLVFVSELDALNKEAVRNKLFSSNPDDAPVVSAGLVKDQSTQNRSDRYYPALSVVATYAGAVQKTGITATFS